MNEKVIQFRNEDESDFWAYILASAIQGGSDLNITVADGALLRYRSRRLDIDGAPSGAGEDR